MVGGQSSFRLALKTHRKELWVKRGRRPFVPKFNRVRYPFRYERELKRKLTFVFSAFLNVFYEWVNGKEADWIKLNRYTHYQWKKDGWETELDFLLRSLETQINTYTSETGVVGFSLSDYFQKVSEAIFVFSTNDFADKLEKLVGHSFYGQTDWWSAVRKDWTSLLEKKATSSMIDFMSLVRKTVYNGVRNDVPFETILSDIKKLGPYLSESRASFLARDMVGTLHSQIMKNLHLVIGVTDYLWQTQADERVRGRPDGLYPKSVPSHWEMEGVYCRWSDPTTFSLDMGKTWVPRTELMPKQHTGEPYSCRCLPRPILSGIIDEVDKEIRREL